MNRLCITALLAAFVGAGLAGTASAREAAQPAQARLLGETVKPGQWEFNSQLQMPAMPQMPAGAPLPSGTTMQPRAGMKSTYRTCVDSEKAVPSDPRGQCKIENVERKGATVSWTGTCATGQGTVRSEGVAGSVEPEPLALEGVDRGAGQFEEELVDLDGRHEAQARHGLNPARDPRGNGVRGGGELQPKPFFDIGHQLRRGEAHL